jgi:hypothetical protein
MAAATAATSFSLESPSAQTAERRRRRRRGENNVQDNWLLLHLMSNCLPMVHMVHPSSSSSSSQTGWALLYAHGPCVPVVVFYAHFSNKKMFAFLPSHFVSQKDHLKFG